jgi:hypothetical protein
MVKYMDKDSEEQRGEENSDYSRRRGCREGERKSQGMSRSDVNPGTSHISLLPTV